MIVKILSIKNAKDGYQNVNALDVEKDRNILINAMGVKFDDYLNMTLDVEGTLGTTPWGVTQLKVNAKSRIAVASKDSSDVTKTDVEQMKKDLMTQPIPKTMFPEQPQYTLEEMTEILDIINTMAVKHGMQGTDKMTYITEVFKVISVNKAKKSQE